MSGAALGLPWCPLGTAAVAGSTPNSWMPPTPCLFLGAPALGSSCSGCQAREWWWWRAGPCSASSTDQGTPTVGRGYMGVSGPAGHSGSNGQSPFPACASCPPSPSVPYQPGVGRAEGGSTALLDLPLVVMQKYTK